MRHDHDHSRGPAGHGHAIDGHAGHGHHHHQGSAATGTGFAIGTVLNLAFVIVEAGFGIAAHSMALLADAGHNLGDVLGLAAAWVAVLLSQRQPSRRFTYGLRSSSTVS